MSRARSRVALLGCVALAAAFGAAAQAGKPARVIDTFEVGANTYVRALTVEPSRGAEQTVSTAKYEITGRGGKGRELMQRGQFTRVVTTPAPSFK